MKKKEPPSNQELISDINENYKKLLGYSVEETKLKELNKKQWNSFCEDYSLDNNSSGIYLPRNQTAIMPLGNKLSLFHEYFGHGLFCEKSLIGVELVSLEKRLLKEEREYFKNKIFGLKEINEFREGNKTFQLLKKLQGENLSLYEGFAVWTEYFLSREFDTINIFENKYDNIEKESKKSIDELISFNKTYGDLATFYNFGMARRTTPERVKKLLEGIYGERLKNVKLAVLYGSKKEFSDIDVFIVSDNLPETDCSWFDVRVEKEKDFENMVKMFDVSITNSIINSELIIGNEQYFKEKRKQLEEQPITREAIRYNLEKSEEQKIFALNFPENSEKSIHGLNYSLTYLANALALSENRRLLSKEELLHSQSENIKMKGGLE
jgi:predicted nucleotidyltransferase